VRRADRATGLSPQRLSALSVIVFAGPVSIGALAEAEQVSAPTISRLVKGLERAGLVARRTDERDTRVTLLEATASGRKVLEQGRRRRIELIVERLSRLGGKDRRLLDRAAGLMARVASAEAAPVPPSRGRARGW
jgi:DNA-binding MarR family transcriptional regulator